jgi:hypothetical protein
LIPPPDRRGSPNHLLVVVDPGGRVGAALDGAARAGGGDEARGAKRSNCRSSARSRLDLVTASRPDTRLGLAVGILGSGMFVTLLVPMIEAALKPRS